MKALRGVLFVLFIGLLIVASWALFIGVPILGYGIAINDPRGIVVGFLLILMFLAVAMPLWWHIMRPPPRTRSVARPLAPRRRVLHQLDEIDWPWPVLVRECAHTENALQNSGQIGADAPAFSSGHGGLNTRPGHDLRPLGSRAGSGADGVHGRTPGPARLGGAA